MATRSSKPRPIVAELGRPETLEEEAARKAQNSKNYRESKTIRNLWVATAVIVGIVALMVLIVPRDDSSRLQAVDYKAVAVSAQRSLSVPLAVPDLPDTYTSNVAEIRTASLDNVSSWYLGLITPSKSFLSITQESMPTPAGSSTSCSRRARPTPSRSMESTGPSTTTVPSVETSAMSPTP